MNYFLFVIKPVLKQDGRKADGLHSKSCCLCRGIFTAGCCFSAAGSNCHVNQNWFRDLVLSSHVVRELLSTSSFRLLQRSGRSSQTPQHQDTINRWNHFLLPAMRLTSSKAKSTAVASDENQKLQSAQYRWHSVHWHWQWCPQTSETLKTKSKTAMSNHHIAGFKPPKCSWWWMLHCAVETRTYFL